MTVDLIRYFFFFFSLLSLFSKNHNSTFRIKKKENSRVQVKIADGGGLLSINNRVGWEGGGEARK